MLFYKTFSRHLLSCLRRCRSSDWKDLYISSTFFVACCILTYVAWNLGAPGGFLFLYVFLCAVGMMISCFKKLKVSGETSPLDPQKQFEIYGDKGQKQSTEKIIHTLTEALISSKDKLDENTSAERYSESTAGDQQHVLLDVDVSETQINTNDANAEPITCTDRNYDPRVTLEQYATGPSPGGRNSRESDVNGEEQSRDNRLSPLKSPFRQQPGTEARSVFHVPLTETKDIPDDGAFASRGNSHVPISQSIQHAKIEKEGTRSDMSPYFQQPIYQTLEEIKSDMSPNFQHPLPTIYQNLEEIKSNMTPNFQQPIYQNLEELKRNSPESHQLKRFDNNEYFSKSFEAVEDKDGVHELSSSVPALTDKLKIYQRLRPLDSSERMYANVVVSTNEKPTERGGNHQFANISDSAEDSRPTGNPKNESEPFSTSSMPFHYDKLESYKRLEPIYVNVRPLGENVDQEQNVSSQCFNKTSVNYSETENVSKNSPGTLSPPSEEIYMNWPNYLYEKETCIKKKIKRHRTAASPPYPEMDSSKTEERTLKTKSKASNTNKSRSDNTHISTFETTTIFHVEQKSMEVKSDISTVPKLTSPRNHQKNKNDSSNSCSTKKTEQHNACDQKILPVSDFPSKRNETQSEDYFRISKMKSSTSNRPHRRGTSLGEYLSLTSQFEEHSRSRRDFKMGNSSNIKHIKYDNPNYGADKNVNKSEDEILTKVDEKSNETACSDDSIAFKMNETRIVQSSSNNQVVLNETFLVNETSNLSADFEGNSQSKKHSVLGEGDATFVKQLNAVTSEDEDPICFSKSLKVERKNFESSSYASSFEKLSISRSSYLEPFSKHLNSSSTYPTHNKIHRTKTSDNEFSTRKQIESVNRSSIEERYLKESISNTNFQISKLEPSPKSRNDSNLVTPPSHFRKSPRILPPLDKNYLSPTLKTSDKVSPSKSLDLPVKMDHNMSLNQIHKSINF